MWKGLVGATYYNLDIKASKQPQKLSEIEGFLGDISLGCGIASNGHPLPLLGGKRKKAKKKGGGGEKRRGENSINCRDVLPKPGLYFGNKIAISFLCCHSS